MISNQGRAVMLGVPRLHAMLQPPDLAWYIEGDWQRGIRTVADDNACILQPTSLPSPLNLIKAKPRHDMKEQFMHVMLSVWLSPVTMRRCGGGSTQPPDQVQTIVGGPGSKMNLSPT